MLKEMKAYGHLKPGQKGTQRLVARFGAALICDRYRYDERTGDNLTTAELIVDRRPKLMTARYRDTDLVAVSAPYTETALRERLKRPPVGDGIRRNVSGASVLVRFGVTLHWWNGS